MAAASYHPQILSPKYGQTTNVKPRTANHGLPFAVGQTSILRSLVFLSTVPYGISISQYRSLRQSKCACFPSS